MPAEAADMATEAFAFCGCSGRASGVCARLADVHEFVKYANLAMAAGVGARFAGLISSSCRRACTLTGWQARTTFQTSRYTAVRREPLSQGNQKWMPARLRP
jgi:hypothetical protein